MMTIHATNESESHIEMAVRHISKKIKNEYEPRI
jgi:hypothetical protein